MMKHVNFKERKKAVQIVSKRSAVIAQRCRSGYREEQVVIGKNRWLLGRTCEYWKNEQLLGRKSCYSGERVVIGKNERLLGRTSGYWEERVSIGKTSSYWEERVVFGQNE